MFLSNLGFLMYKMGLCHSYATNGKVICEAVLPFGIQGGHKQTWTQETGPLILVLSLSATVREPPPLSNLQTGEELS